jgi:O-antigen biosynthesis protein
MSWVNWLGRTLTGKRRRKPMDPAAHWSWVLPEPFGSSDAIDAVSPNSVTWFLPPVGRGSGGHLNIFRFIQLLEQRGYDCRIVICQETRGVDAAMAKQQIHDWFMPLDAPVYMHPGQPVPPSHFAIATGWQTAYAVKAFRGARQQVYFVQDYEPSFHGAGSIATFAENTYRFGFPVVTFGSWLASLMRQKYGATAHALGFGLDHTIYRPVERKASLAGRHVFFYARPPTERRGFELGMLALRTLCARMTDVTVHLAGWPMDKFTIPFPHVNHGILPVQALPSLYAMCDVALVFSFSNISLLPLEIMACGTPVVSNRGEHVEWILNDANAKLVDATPEAVSTALEQVLTDLSLRRSLRASGLRTAATADWAQEGDRMAGILQLLAGSHAQPNRDPVADGVALTSKER